jgi:metal-responsive CopG/Arc/MetJ family transcriptional regulator
MKASAKIAISLPADTFRALERVRRRMGTSRSAAVARAIEAWVNAVELGPEDKRYAEAYLRAPERTAETAAIAAEAVAEWEPWR